MAGPGAEGDERRNGVDAGGDLTTDGHRALRETLGAYLLDGLDDAEQARVRAHLDGCSPCRAELASLTPLVPALADIDLDALDNEPTPDVTLEQRILAKVAVERRRHRVHSAVRTGGLAAAGCLLAVMAFRVGVLSARSPSAALAGEVRT